MSKMSDWSGQIREDERRMEDDREFGYTSYAEAMFLVSQRRERESARKRKNTRISTIKTKK